MCVCVHCCAFAASDNANTHSRLRERKFAQPVRDAITASEMICALFFFRVKSKHIQNHSDFVIQ